MLAFREAYPHRSNNLKRLYHIEDIPADTALREGLDGVQPSGLQGRFAPLMDELRTAGALESRQVLDGYHVVSVDGTGHFCSDKKSCPHCMVKTQRGGQQYYHQLLAGVLVHPGQRTVFPVAAEAIARQDGSKKNDCELNAAKRLIPLIRQMLPDEKLLLTFDALYANGPLIRLLGEHSMHYITVLKEGYVHIQALRLKERDGLQQYSWDKGQAKCTVRFVNGLVLNGQHRDIRANYVEYEENHSITGKRLYGNSWITDVAISAENAAGIVAAGRARWKVENETLNTLKNQGYYLEHNYGHGKQNLATNFALLTMLAFLVDQMAQHLDGAFQKAMGAYKTKKAFWQRVREITNLLPVKSFNAVYRYISGEIKVDFPLLE